MELAELHATVKQISASSTLLREQLVELSGTQSNRTDTVDSDAVQTHLRQLDSSVQLLHEGMGSLQQSSAMHEQAVEDVSRRIDTLDSSVAHSGAAAQAAESRSALVDSAMQELRCTVESQQQVVDMLSQSVPGLSGAQEQAAALLSEMRAMLTQQAERVAALEQVDSSNDISLLKHQFQETKESLNGVFEKVLSNS